MSRMEVVSAWEGIVSRHLPVLSRPQARVLAWWSLGVVLAQRCGQTSVVAMVAGLVGQSENTVRQRLREWCYAAPDKAGSRRGVARRQLAVETCFAPLLRWILQWWAASGEHPRRLALALDASTLGARVTVLALSVVYRGCAIPVAWVVVRAQEPGAWQPHWRWLLRQAQQSIPADWLVIVLGDRGLYAPWLYQAIVAGGWHPFLRINAGPGNGLYRLPAGGGWRPLTTLLPQVGAAWSGRVFCFLERPLACTLLARWEWGYRDGWVVLTDLAPEEAEVAWYGLRAWIEAGFKDCKRGGWQWQLTRMSDPARISRFWLVLALATLWVVSVGSAAEEPPAPAAPAASQRTRRSRRVSCVRRGVTTILLALIQGRALPLGQFWSDPWPTPGSIRQAAHPPPAFPRASSRRRKTYP